MSNIRLTWDDVGDIDEGYDIYRTESGNPLSTSGMELIGSTDKDTLEFVDDTFEVLNDNYYRIASKIGSRKKFSQEYHIPAWTPISLFQSNENGVWYDPSDESTLYQDAAGTIPVVNDGDPVGLMLDKSQGLELGPELVVSTVEGFFVIGSTDETLRSSPSGTRTTEWIPVTIGSSYRLSVDISSRRRVQGRNSSGVISYLTDQSAESSADGVLLRLPPDIVEFRVYFAGESIDGASAVFSVRELKGNHATQTVAASRPVYQRGDSRGVVNLLKWSEDLTKSAWVRGTITISGDELTATTTAHAVYQPYTVTPGAEYTYQFKAKRGTMTDTKYSVFDVTNISNVVAPTSYFSEINDSTFTVVTVSFTAPAGCTTVRIYPLRDSGVTGTVFVKDNQAESGSTATPYQRNDSHLGGVSTGNDSDLRWLEFDGVDDFLSTGNIDFTSTDKMSVFAGVRKLNDAGVTPMVELGTSAVENGSLTIYGPLSAGGNNFSVRSRGSVAAFANVSASAPVSAVLAATATISLDELSLRLNGGAASVSSADQGSGNYGNLPLYMGRRGGTSLPFNGWIYGLVVNGKGVSDSEVINSESYIANKLGIDHTLYPPEDVNYEYV